MAKKMLRFHEASEGSVSEERYVAVSDVHRIDACEKDVPAYTQGVRSFIRGRGKDPFCYRAHETAAELILQIDS